MTKLIAYNYSRWPAQVGKSLACTGDNCVRLIGSGRDTGAGHLLLVELRGGICFTCVCDVDFKHHRYVIMAS